MIYLHLGRDQLDFAWLVTHSKEMINSDSEW